MAAKSVCEHVTGLRAEMRARGIEIWSEHGEQPHGWVNVFCGICKRTFEVTMRPKHNSVAEYE
jgi:hypothetical protein